MQWECVVSLGAMERWTLFPGLSSAQSCVTFLGRLLEETSSPPGSCCVHHPYHMAATPSPAPPLIMSVEGWVCIEWGIGARHRDVCFACVISFYPQHNPNKKTGIPNTDVISSVQRGSVLCSKSPPVRTELWNLSTSPEKVQVPHRVSSNTGILVSFLSWKNIVILCRWTTHTH